MEDCERMSEKGVDICGRSSLIANITRHDCASDYVIPLPPVPPHRPAIPTLGSAWLGSLASLIHSTFANVVARRHIREADYLFINKRLVTFNAMLKESTRYDNRNTVQDEGRPLASTRLPAIEELTLGLKQKLHLQARARAAPYYIRKQEPVDLVERLLEQRALVAEAVRRLQEKKQSCHEISVDS
ncbi:hypothetical protein RR46_13726 [Papilio xuthus]|uniref:Uncharacterized protein n=1 Tax=Papilio xuthus TaxID=66420 RepID=A0A194PN05_PAPXU|nr:hypothetical protein RR46_13726 [Papilio xuthus]